MYDDGSCKYGRALSHAWHGSHANLRLEEAPTDVPHATARVNRTHVGMLTINFVSRRRNAHFLVSLLSNPSSGRLCVLMLSRRLFL